MPPRLIVCVPARNEQRLLPRLLRCLAKQQQAPAFGVLLLANNCSDHTAGQARQMTSELQGIALRVVEETFPPALAHAGSARRAAMESGAVWLRQEGEGRGVLVTTDADAAPPPHWLAAIDAAFAAGADCVGGRIVAEATDADELPAPIRRMQHHIQRYWAAVRGLSDAIDPLPHDPPPRHGDHTGGSLALTLAMFDAVGGVPPRPTGEDHALVAAIEAHGGRVRHAPDVWVPVSARLQGRAEGGMAAEMQRWMLAEADDTYLLPSAAFWQKQARQRRQIRMAYGLDPQYLATMFGLPAEVTAKVVASSRNDIAFVSRIAPLLPSPPSPQQGILAATVAMEAMIQ